MKVIAYVMILYGALLLTLGLTGKEIKEVIV